MTHTQFVLLASLKWLTENGLEENPSQRELADHAGTDQMMTSTSLRNLEKRCLVARISDPSDARVRRIALTVPGEVLIGKALAAAHRIDEKFLGRVRDREQILSLLVSLASDGANPDVAP